MAKKLKSGKTKKHTNYYNLYTKHIKRYTKDVLKK